MGVGIRQGLGFFVLLWLGACIETATVNSAGHHHDLGSPQGNPTPTEPPSESIDPPDEMADDPSTGSEVSDPPIEESAPPPPKVIEPVAPTPVDATHNVLTRSGRDFFINGQATFPNSAHLRGKLTNSRMAGALSQGGSDFDSFLANLPGYSQHGLKAVTVFMQGAAGSSVNPYNSDGTIKTSPVNYKTLVTRLLAAADSAGMVVNVGLFYIRRNDGTPDSTELGPELRSDTAIKNAVVQTAALLKSTGHKNYMIEISNENNSGWTSDLLLGPSSGNGCKGHVQDLVTLMKEQYAGDSFKPLVASSLSGGGVPCAALAQAEDVILLHGNGIRKEKFLARIEGLSSTKPVMVNEDEECQNYVNSGQSNESCAGTNGYLGIDPPVRSAYFLEHMQSANFSYGFFSYDSYQAANKRDWRWNANANSQAFFNHLSTLK